MPFKLEEATISAIHTALRAGELSCAELVAGYLARIDAYDRSGPTINSIVTVNPRAQDEAAQLDTEFAACLLGLVSVQPNRHAANPG